MFKMNPFALMAGAMALTPRRSTGMPDMTTYKRTASDGNHHYMSMNFTRRRGKFKPRSRQHG